MRCSHAQGDEGALAKGSKELAPRETGCDALLAGYRWLGRLRFPRKRGVLGGSLHDSSIHHRQTAIFASRHVLHGGDGSRSQSGACRDAQSEDPFGVALVIFPCGGSSFSVRIGYHEVYKPSPAFEV